MKLESLNGNNGMDRKERSANEVRPRAPIAIMGVPFDNVTASEAIVLIEGMIQSRQPHYLVTANVDFLAQARGDVELRRILTDAHLVLCDGTPLVWASRWLGNPLAERVAGADLVPLLIRVAAEKNYRLFLLGATPESASRAVANLTAQYPSLMIAGHYSPPFSRLLDMDHAEIKRRIVEARADILLVSFGCPKQEKWMWMHYRSLPVPVLVGVGATIDFLAGQVKRAPVWMQRTGTEWVFRLAQEPRRLFSRYVKDLWVFGGGIVPQIWHLQMRRAARVLGTRRQRGETARKAAVGEGMPTLPAYQVVEAPQWLDTAAVHDRAELWEQIVTEKRDCVIDLHQVRFVDSTGIGVLIKLQKRVRAAGRMLVLVAPSPNVRRALKLMRLEDSFCVAADMSAAERLLNATSKGPTQSPCERPGNGLVQWQGEVTAGNVDLVWEHTANWLRSVPEDRPCVIDLSQVPFIDSSGLGLMVRAKKQAVHQQRALSFTGLRPPVRNVLKLARLEGFLLQ